MMNNLPEEVVQLVILLEATNNWLKTRNFPKNMLSNSDRRVFVDKLQDIIAATQSLKYL